MTISDPRIYDGPDFSVAREDVPAPPRGGTFKTLLPGLLLTSAIAAAAFGLNKLPYLGIASPLILSILLGMLMRNSIGVPAFAQPGLTFSLRRVLRFAIVLLGLQLTVAQIGEVGMTGVSVIVATLTASFIFTTVVGRLLGVEHKLTQLIAAGTSICGASAVIAVDTVTGAEDEDVAYAVACVTVFGSIAMFAYPQLAGILHLAPARYGLWAGASIHEIAQVVAATYQHGPVAGEIGTIAKLTRVGFLAPVVLILGSLTSRQRSGSRSATAPGVPIPWFVLGFVAMIAVNSVVAIHGAPKTAIVMATTFLLSVALAAMGLETHIGKLRAKGLRPLLLGLISFLFIATFSLGLVKIVA
ncbi:MAG TPA: YeiH family protein [Methylovirgula sp.]